MVLSSLCLLGETLGTLLSHRSEVLSYYGECLLRASHGDVGYAQDMKPVEHPQQIRHHSAKCAALFVSLPVLIWRNGTHHHVFLVDIDAGASLIHNVHGFPPRMTKTLQRQAMGCQAWVKFSPTCFPMPGATDGGAGVASRSHCWSGSQHECQADL